MPEERADLAGQRPLQQPSQQVQSEYTIPRRPDKNWPNREPLHIPVTQERLNAPHQLVTITNYSDREGNPPRPQTHIVIDRFQQGIEIHPGQTKHDIDLLKSDIEYFLKARRPNQPGKFGGFKPLHPLYIHDVRLEEEEQPAQVTPRVNMTDDEEAAVAAPEEQAPAPRPRRQLRSRNRADADAS